MIVLILHHHWICIQKIKETGSQKAKGHTSQVCLILGDFLEALTETFKFTGQNCFTQETSAAKNIRKRFLAGQLIHPIKLGLW